MAKKALITGISGQDGSYLAELLIEKGYEVHGLLRPSATVPLGRLDPVFAEREMKSRRLTLHHGGLSDAEAILELIARIQPDEVYNLGAQSDVRNSFDTPVYTLDVTATGAIRLLEALHQKCPSARYYQASSSEMFGKARETPQNERTPFHPRSPYACAKVCAYWATVNYREAYGMHAGNGILFNHESPRRGETFVSRKVTLAVARIKAGLQKRLTMGNLDACRDWGYAKEYVEVMWLMLQQPEPDDYVVATGETHSIKELLEVAFSHVGLAWQDFVDIDPRFYRPAEVERLQGDASRAQKKLGWKPKTSFADLIRLMVDADLAALKST